MKKKLVSLLLTASMVLSMLPTWVIPVAAVSTTDEEASVSVAVSTQSTQERTYAEYLTPANAPEIPIMPAGVSDDFIEKYAENIDQNTSYTTFSANPKFKFYLGGTVEPYVYPNDPMYENRDEYYMLPSSGRLNYHYYETVSSYTQDFFTSELPLSSPFTFENGVRYGEGAMNAYSSSTISKTSIPNFTAITKVQELTPISLGSGEMKWNDSEDLANFNKYPNYTFYVSLDGADSFQDYNIVLQDTQAPNVAQAIYEKRDDGHYLVLRFEENLRMSAFDIDEYADGDSFQIQCTAVDMANEATIEEKLIGTAVMVDGSYFSTQDSYTYEMPDAYAIVDQKITEAHTIISFKLDDDFLAKHTDIRITYIDEVQKESPLQYYGVTDSGKVAVMDIEATSTYPVTDIAGNPVDINFWASSQSGSKTWTWNEVDGNYCWIKSTRASYTLPTLDIDTKAPEIVKIDISLSADDMKSWPYTTEDSWPDNISRELLFRSDVDERDYNTTYYVHFDEPIYSNYDTVDDSYISGIYSGRETSKYSPEYVMSTHYYNTCLSFSLDENKQVINTPIMTNGVYYDAVSIGELLYPTAFNPNGGIYDLAQFTTMDAFVDTFFVKKTAFSVGSSYSPNNQMVGEVNLTEIPKEKEIYLDTVDPTIKITKLNEFNVVEDLSFVAKVEFNDTADTEEDDLPIGSTERRLAAGVSGKMAEFMVTLPDGMETDFQYAISSTSSSAPRDSEYVSGRTGQLYGFPAMDNSNSYIFVKGLEGSNGFVADMTVSVTDWAMNPAEATRKGVFSYDAEDPTIDLKMLTYNGSAFRATVTVNDDNYYGVDEFEYQWVVTGQEPVDGAWLTADNKSTVESLEVTESSTHQTLYVKASDYVGKTAEANASFETSLSPVSTDYTLNFDTKVIQYEAPDLTLRAPEEETDYEIATIAIVDNGTEKYYLPINDNDSTNVNIFDRVYQSTSWYKLESFSYDGNTLILNPKVETANTEATTYYARDLLCDGDYSAVSDAYSVYGEVTVDFFTIKDDEAHRPKYSNYNSYVTTFTYSTTEATVDGADNSTVVAITHDSLSFLYGGDSSIPTSEVFAINSLTASGTAWPELSSINTSSSDIQYYYHMEDSLAGLSFDVSLTSLKTEFGDLAFSDIDSAKSKFLLKNASGTTVWSTNLLAVQNQTVTLPTAAVSALEQGLYYAQIEVYRNYSTEAITQDFGTPLLLDKNGLPTFGLFGYEANFEGMSEGRVDGEQDIEDGALSEVTINLAPENTAEGVLYITKQLFFKYEDSLPETFFNEGVYNYEGLTLGETAKIRVWNKAQTGTDDVFWADQTWQNGWSSYDKYWYISNYSRDTDGYNNMVLVDKVNANDVVEKTEDGFYLPLTSGKNTICMQIQMSDGTLTPVQEATVNVITKAPEISVTETPVNVTVLDDGTYMSALNVKLNYASSTIGSVETATFVGGKKTDDGFITQDVTTAMDGTVFDDSEQFVSGTQIVIVAWDEYGGYACHFVDTKNYTQGDTAIGLASLDTMTPDYISCSMSSSGETPLDDKYQFEIAPKIMSTE